MKNRKIYTLIALVIGVGLSLSGCGKKQEIKVKPIISVIVQADFIGDRGMTDSLVSTLEKIQEKKDMDIRFFEIANDQNNKVILEEAVNEGANLIICLGNKMNSSILELSATYPNVNFAILEGNLSGDNITNITFDDSQSSFLAGYLAGIKTQSKKIGYIGVTNDENKEFEAGFIAGAKYFEKDIEIIKGYIDDNTSLKDGFDKANELIEQGADVLYHNVAIAGKGVIEACSNKEVWVIGSQRDQSHLSSKFVLASTVKNLYTPLEKVVSQSINDKFKKDDINYDLKNGGVSISDKAGNIDRDSEERLKSVKDLILQGKLVIPKNDVELKEFLGTLK